MAIKVEKLSHDEQSQVDFGAQVSGLDLENLSDEAFAELRQVLYNNQVVVIRNCKGLSSRAQYQLTKRFDPEADMYGHGAKKLDDRSILHKDLQTVPDQPQVQVIGHGYVESFEGLKNFRLTHPHHRTFHKESVPLEDDLDFTHFYRWHIDAALYGLDPPRVTSLFAVQVPSGRRQTIRYDDGTGQELDVPLGTTAFFSGYQLYDSLSEEDKNFVRTSRVEYAAHPYVWMSKAKSLPNGLGLCSDDLELLDSQMPAVDDSKIKCYPMTWTNPVTGKLAVMVHAPAARRIHLASGEVISDLKEVRQILYRLQRPAIDPQNVFAHDWAEGDLVLFNNHGVMHSVVGSFGEDEVRIFRQCNMAASAPPVGPESTPMVAVGAA